MKEAQRKHRSSIRLPAAKVKACKKLAQRIDAEEGEDIKAMGREVFRQKATKG